MRHPMQNTFSKSLSLGLTAALLMVLPSSLFAAVNTAGDVPTAGSAFGADPDDDGNGFDDVIRSAGNEVFSFFADPNDTNTFDDAIIWEDYETDQNILIGQTSAGSLEINGASSLRYQHLVLGGVSSSAPFTGGLDLTISGPTTANYDFQMDLAANDIPITGVGIVNVSGFGSTFNNAPSVVPGEFLTALSVSPSPSTPLTPTPDNTSRPIDGGTQAGGGYDVHVGLIGSGILSVEGGGSVQIQDGLFAGLGGTASGVITVDGFGSSISAFGRNMVSNSGDSTPTTEFGSIIGGHGSGNLSITNGGRVDMFNGASIGAANSTTTLSGDGVGSGTVTVADNGSFWNVYASNAVQDPTLGGAMGMATDIALAVGELRNRVGSFPTEPLGSGTLEITTGARVNITQTDTYTGTLATDAKMVVGYNGKVLMSGGSLSIDDAIINDGNFQGYGQVVAGSFNNTTLGAIDAGSEVETNTLDLQVSGVVNNDGSIRGNGNITSGSFYNGSLGSVVVGEGERLKIVSTTSRTPGTDGYSEFDETIALSNPGFGLQTDLDGDQIVDAADANFLQANLGSIRVEGGELEFGNADPVNPLDDVSKGVAFHNGRYVLAESPNPFVAGTPITGAGAQVAETVIGTITGTGGTLNFKSGLYNTGVIAFTGGSNTVVGNVLNGSMDYDPATDGAIDDPATLSNPDVFNNQLILPGVILVSGDNTTVTFTDDVVNEGVIALGPNQTVANFLSDLTLAPGGEVSFYTDFFSSSSAIVVGGDLNVNGSLLTSIPATAFASASSSSSSATSALSSSSLEAGMSMSLLSAGGELSEESLFTDLNLPELEGNLYWDVVYDTVQDEIRLEIIESLAYGADFSGDGVVDGDDMNIWIANVGITNGASVIQGDADLDGDVDLNDYLLLSQQIFTGIPVLAGGGASASVAVPEPSAALLALLAFSATGMIRRKS